MISQSLLNFAKLLVCGSYLYTKIGRHCYVQNVIEHRYSWNKCYDKF